MIPIIGKIRQRENKRTQSQDKEITWKLQNRRDHHDHCQITTR